MGQSMFRKYLKSFFFLLVIFTCTLSQQRDKPCNRGFECVKRDECEHYNAEIKRSKEVTKKSKEWYDIIQALKSLICNQKDRKLCCKIKSNNPDSPGYLPGDGDCGVTGDAAFIVGGQDTKLGEFPWSALIRKKGRSRRWHCGATLINKWYVVSAAHCVDDGEDLEEVRLGEWKVKDVDKFDFRSCTYFYESQKQDCERHRFCGAGKRRGNIDCTYKNPNVDCDDCEDCPELQDIKVASFQKHPNYRQNQDGVAFNDILMIKLSRPAVYNKLVKPVCLPSPTFDNLLGEEGHTPGYFKDQSVVVGWGRTYREDYQETLQTASSNQQKLTTPLLSNGECIDLFKTPLPPESALLASLNKFRLSTAASRERLVPQVEESVVFDRPMPLDKLPMPEVRREPGLERQIVTSNGLADQRWRAGSSQCLANLNSWPSRLSLVE